MICEKCESTKDVNENEYGEFICDECVQNAEEAAYDRMCEDFHDGGSTVWPDAERKRMEEARKFK